MCRWCESIYGIKTLRYNRKTINEAEPLGKREDTRKTIDEAEPLGKREDTRKTIDEAEPHGKA